jgi:hypothetical protein
MVPGSLVSISFVVLDMSKRALREWLQSDVRSMACSRKI